jgi:hypothetical protein
MAVPMMYSTGGAGSAWDYQLQDWLTHVATYDTQLVAGNNTSHERRNVLRALKLARRTGKGIQSFFVTETPDRFVRVGGFHGAWDDRRFVTFMPHDSARQLQGNGDPLPPYAVRVDLARRS